MKKSEPNSAQSGFLGYVERVGNRLPDPVFIFVYLIGILIVISMICSLAGVSAEHPTQKNEDGAAVVLSAKSLLSAENIQKVWVEMPKTFTHFHPLGYVLVVMLGAGVAERSGLFASGIKSAMRYAPKNLLTPTVALVAMLSNHAADAGYVVVIPLAAIVFAAAGRHPLAGIAAGFAGVSGGFSANITPGQLDALLFGVTEAAVEGAQLNSGWTMNIAGNWFFIAALLFVYLPVIWYVTDKIIEPRLGQWVPGEAHKDSFGENEKPLTEGERRGLQYAGWAILGVVLLWLMMTFGPETPLLDDGPGTEGQEWYVTATPFFKSLVGAFMITFLAAGWVYGKAAGTIKSNDDLIVMMTESMKDMGYYLVLSFVAAHFVAMFSWSNLGLISAVHGAGAIESSGLPLPIVIGMIVIFAAVLNLFVGSASAKWALLAPVLVPMLMLLGVSPEGATAAYRVGDGATNIISPLMVYFPLVLVFANRWQKDFGIGSLTAMMIPYSIWMLITGAILMILWMTLGIYLGPGAPMGIELPSVKP
ncbi:MAG: AbgT family transporter [Akkermansiaceae bacterium]|jgi:aminobenzoyl-glutamate transport protein